MIDGDPKEFVEGLHYGDERWYYFRGRKYFIQGYCEDGDAILEIYSFDPDEIVQFHWVAKTKERRFPVERFEQTKIFDGMTFWEAQEEIVWLDTYLDDGWPILEEWKKKNKES